MTGERLFTYDVYMENKPHYKILEFYKKYRRMPSYAEIMKLFKYKSKNAAFRLINKMVEARIIEKDMSGRIIPKKNFFCVIPLVTQPVEAGWPSPAEEELIDTISLDEFLIHNKEATVVAPVKGDSMIEAGIVDGDMVLVERDRIAKDGDIIIAEIDREYTMKYLRKRNGRPYLEPANKKYKPIYPTEDQEFKIVGVVISVIRKIY